MWLLGRGLFRPFGPVGLGFAAYRVWRRLPEARKQEIKGRARNLATKLQRVATPVGGKMAKIDVSRSR
jgi:hypothetical protein